MTRPGAELFEICRQEAIRLEEEKWNAGLGGITSQEVLDSLRRRGEPLLLDYEKQGGNHKWTAAIFTSVESRGQWQKFGLRVVGTRTRNTGSMARTVWYRYDRPPEEVKRRSGVNGTATALIPSVMKRPTDRVFRQAIASLHATVAWAKALGFEPPDPHAVQQTMDWLRGTCGGDEW
jgi:hypothetical protein